MSEHPTDFESLVASWPRSPDSRAARAGFKESLFSLIEVSSARSVIEIGGGRSPFLSEAEAEGLGLDYTVNDISRRELERAPNWVRRACFDIATGNQEDVSDFSSRYDLAFSQMVMEHVVDFRKAYANISSILAPGGVSIAYHPVLFAFPFLLNKMLPESLAASLLRTIQPHRTDDGVPKFPAVYSGCRIGRDVRQVIESAGFDKVWQVPFYGHRYYRKFPVVRDVHSSLTRTLARRQVTALSSFCYTVARKSDLSRSVS